MGQSTPCAGGAALVYSVESVEGISYHWQVPDGWLIQGVDTTNQITVDAGNLGGVISVTPKNEFGMGEPTILVVTTVPVPDSPAEGVHKPSYYNITWNCKAVEDATGYKRNHINDLESAVDNLTSTTFTQHGLQQDTPYSYYVWAYNTCGDSEATSLSSMTLLDATASPIFTWEMPQEPSDKPDSKIK